MKKGIYTDSYQLLISKLIKARKDKKFSQSNLAQLLKTNQKHISRIENIETEIKIYELYQWVEVLELNFIEVMKTFDKFI